MRSLTIVRANMTMPATQMAPTKTDWRSFFQLDLLDNRYPYIHGLRVLGIISVVQIHVSWILEGEHQIHLNRDFASSSYAVFFGMDLFFILSGFLIGSILLHSIATAGSQQVKRFYIRRIFRTFPSYYFVLAVLALTTTMTAAQRRNLPYEAAYLTDFLPPGSSDTLMFWGWSLALEEQFYLTVPLLFLGLRYLRSDTQRVTLLAVMWASALAVRLGIFIHGAPWTDGELYTNLYFRPHTRFDTLVAGLMLAVVHRRWGAQIQEWLRAPFHRALLGLPALLCFWFLMRPPTFRLLDRQVRHVFEWGTVTTIMYFCIILLLLHSDGPIKRALSVPMFRSIATLGYGVYLVHMPICDRYVVPIAEALLGKHVPLAIVWPICLVLVLLFATVTAYVLHIAIEKPAFRLRAHFSP
ncbi:MAG TPA: acyltransferase [Polyangiales bacterium]